VKYTVDVNGERHNISLEGGRARFEDAEMVVQLETLPGSPVHLIRIGDAVHRVVARRGDRRGKYSLWIDGFRYEVDALDERTRAIQDLAAASGAPRGPAPLVAPMPGMIVRVNVEVGSRVSAGQGLVVMEAMKMENELRSAAAGVVKAVHATPGKAVEKGTILIELTVDS
jgi:pyruvate carboxylase subunit B